MRNGHCTCANGHHGQRAQVPEVPSPSTPISGAIITGSGGDANGRRTLSRFQNCRQQRNGKKMPTLSNSAALEVIYCTIPDIAITLPSTPPAAVTNKNWPHGFQCFSVGDVIKFAHFFCCQQAAIRQTGVPTASAMMGRAQKDAQLVQQTAHFSTEATEPRAINIMGARIGLSASIPLGRCPYSATICS